jgi:hypothetical protein
VCSSIYNIILNRNHGNSPSLNIDYQDNIIYSSKHSATPLGPGIVWIGPKFTNVGTTRPIFYVGQMGKAAVSIQRYKNMGYYPVDGVFEEWVSVGRPGTLPPSGHVLIDVGYIVIDSYGSQG